MNSPEEVLSYWFLLGHHYEGYRDTPADRVLAVPEAVDEGVPERFGPCRSAAERSRPLGPDAAWETDAAHRTEPDRGVGRPASSDLPIGRRPGSAW